MIVLLLIIVAVVGAAATGNDAAPSPSTQEKPSSPVSAGPTANEIAAFKSEGARFMGLMTECDVAVDAVPKVMARGNVYASYHVVNHAAGICQAASNELGDFSWKASLSGRQKTALEGMNDACKMAYMERSIQMATAAKILNGDTSPAAVDSLTNARQAADAQAAQCAAGMFSAASSAGFDAGDLTNHEPEGSAPAP